MTSALASPWTSWPTALDVCTVPLLGERAIAQRQHERLARLLAHAQAHSPVYRRLWQGRSVDADQLGALPVAHKRHLMKHFADWVTDPALSLAALRRFTADPARIGQAFEERYTVWESSGSQGEPGMFVQDETAMAVYDALETLRRSSPRPLQRAMDVWYLGERIAFVGAIGGHFASHVSVQRLRRLAPWLAERWQSFSILQPLPALVDQLEQFQPTILATYPTAATLLAAERQQGRLGIAPQEVWTGGETLSAPMRQTIEQAFGCALRNSYGASEFLPIAWECGHGALHVNADWVILEPVDAKHRPVAAGTLSHTTLLTNLANLVQPLVRYDLGDRTRLAAEHCRCGSPLPVIEVLGRCDESLALAGRDGEPVMLLPLAVSTVLEEQAGVFDFSVEQTGAQALCLHLRGNLPDAESRGRQAVQVLKDFAVDQGAKRPTVRLDLCAHLPLGRSGKLQRIACAV